MPTDPTPTVTVTIDRRMATAVAKARAHLKATANRPDDSTMTTSEVGAAYMNEDRATRILADAVIASLATAPAADASDEKAVNEYGWAVANPETWIERATNAATAARGPT